MWSCNKILHRIAVSVAAIIVMRMLMSSKVTFIGTLTFTGMDENSDIYMFNIKSMRNCAARL